MPNREAERLAVWQRQGLVPNQPIVAGEKERMNPLARAVGRIGTICSCRVTCCSELSRLSKLPLLGILWSRAHCLSDFAEL